MTEQTQPTDALLPCPFCGAAAHFEMDEGRWEWVNCEGCGMQGNRSASLMDDCKSKLAEEWNRRTPPAVAPWRSAVLDLIDDCPGLTLEQDQWLSRRVKELDFASTPQAGAAPLTDEFVNKVVRSKQPNLDTDTPAWKRNFDECKYWLTAAHGIKGADHA